MEILSRLFEIMVNNGTPTTTGTTRNSYTLLGQTERLSAWVFCVFWGLILVDSTRNWFYDFASSAGEMELPKSPAAGAIGFRCQRTAVTSTDTAEFVSSTPRTSQNGSSIKGRAIPTQGRSLLESLCLDEMMPARW